MSVLMSHGNGSRAVSFRTSRAPGIGETLRSLLALLWIEIRRSQGHWLLPLMVGPVWYMNLDVNGLGVVLWPEMSHFILQSYLIIGPLAAALAAWLVDRDRRCRIHDLVGTAAITSFSRDLTLLITASFWGLVGYGLIAGWYGSQGVLKATWGRPDVALIAAGALAVVYAAIGLLIGRMFRRAYSSLVAVVASFFLAIVVDYLAKIDTAYRFLTPYGLIQHNEPSVYYRNAETYIGPSLIWLVGLIGMLMSIAALLRGRNLFSLGVLVISGGIASFGLAPILGHDGTVMIPEQIQAIPFEFSCETTAGVELCVHPAYKTRLEETTSTLDRFLQPVAGLDGVPSRWVLQNPMDPIAADGAVLMDLNDFAVAMSFRAGVFLNKADPVLSNTPQLVITQWLSNRAGIPRTAPWPYGWPSEVLVNPEAFANGAMEAGPDQAQLDTFELTFDAATDRFAALSPDAQRAWLEANWDALRAGTLTLEDLP